MKRFFYSHPALATGLVAAVLTFLAYGGSLRNGFVWDDETLIVTNPYVHDLSRWPAYFTTARSISSERLIARTYRPFQTTSLAVDQKLWNGRPGGFHFTSLALHVAICIAVFFLFAEVIGPFSSAVGAILFAIHPALSEGVLSLANRGGQLSALFSLICAGLFLRVRRPLDVRHVLAIMASAVALLSREPAIALIVLLPLLQAVLGRPWPFLSRTTVLLHAPFVAVAGAYLLVRQAVVGSMIVGPYWGGSLGATALLQAKVFAVYLRLLVWPFRLQGRYPFNPLTPFPDLAVIGAILLNGALLAAAFAALRRGGAWRLFSLAVLWFYVSLLPVSNLVPIPVSMLGERFIYFSFAGIFPLLAAAARPLLARTPRPAVVAAGVTFMVAFLAADVTRTPDWKNNTIFFAVLARQEPDDLSIQVYAAQQEIRDGAQQSGLSRLERILGKSSGWNPALADHRQTDDVLRTRYWYCLALAQTGRLSEARRQLALSARPSPRNDIDVRLLYAEIKARTGDLAEALTVLERSARDDPESDAVWNALGNVKWMSGDLAGAAAHYRRAIEINGLNREAVINLGNVIRRLHPDNTPPHQQESAR